MKKIVKALCIGAVELAGAAAVIKFMNKKYVAKEKKRADRNDVNFQVLNVWMQAQLAGKSIESYLFDHGYQKIAIYGMSDIGRLLVQELEHSKIQIAYAIDKYKNVEVINNISVVGLEDKLEQVDAVIVTPVYFFQEIKQDLKQKIDLPIISLEDMLYDMIL